MSPDGPRQPTLAAMQVGSYRGYTGRGDNPIAKAASDPKENLRAFTPSIALTEMNTARYAALPHPNAEPRGRNARAAADCAPLPFSFRSQPEDIEHQGLALLLEFRRVGELPSRARARPRHDPDVLLAVDLERHRRRRKARTHVDLPQLVERGVVVSRDGAIHEGQEHEAAAGRERAGAVRVAQMHVLLDLAAQRIDGGQVALPALVGLAEPAVPAPFLVVFFAVDTDGDAVRQSRDIQELGLGAVGRRPVVVAA